MLGMFKNPYKNSDPYPTVTKAQEAISKYCKENGTSSSSLGDDEVVIGGKCY